MTDAANNAANYQSWVIIIQAGMFLAAIIALFIHMLQVRSTNNEIKENHKWNKKYTATTELFKLKQTIDPEIVIIDEEFGYLNRKNENKISAEMVHDKVCKKGDDGKYVEDQNNKKFEIDDTKKRVHRAIWNALNSYEHIASSVYKNVFDKNIVKDLQKGNIIKIYKIFSDYIDHVNNDMYPKRNGKIWINLKNLAQEFEEE